VPEPEIAPLPSGWEFCNGRSCHKLSFLPGSIPCPTGLKLRASVTRSATLFVRLDYFCDASYILLTNLSRRLPHCAQCRIAAKLRDRIGKIPVQSIAAFLLDFASFRRSLVAVTIIEPWFFHLITSCSLNLFATFSSFAAPNSYIPYVALVAYRLYKAILYRGR
jgi:hypothetical protein